MQVRLAASCGFSPAGSSRREDNGCHEFDGQQKPGGDEGDEADHRGGEPDEFSVAGADGKVQLPGWT